MNTLDEEIVRLCLEVYETLGSGLREKVYQNALNLELQNRYKTTLEYPISILYKGHCMSLCYPDILVNVHNVKVLIEIKCISKLQLKEHLQLQGYIKHSSIQDGYLINFGLRELEIVRYHGTEQTTLTDEDF